MNRVNSRSDCHDDSTINSEGYYYYYYFFFYCEEKNKGIDVNANHLTTTNEINNESRNTCIAYSAAVSVCGSWVTDAALGSSIKSSTDTKTFVKPKTIFFGERDRLTVNSVQSLSQNVSSSYDWVQIFAEIELVAHSHELVSYLWLKLCTILDSAYI